MFYLITFTCYDHECVSELDLCMIVIYTVSLSWSPADSEFLNVDIMTTHD